MKIDVCSFPTICAKLSQHLGIRQRFLGRGEAVITGVVQDALIFYMPGVSSGVGLLDLALGCGAYH